jgi:mono/diheme cytochrome c family protein
LRHSRQKKWMKLFALFAFTAGIACSQKPANGQYRSASFRSAGNGAAGPVTPAKQADASQAANAESGKKLFMSYGCFECHGTVGQGSTATGGARIGPPSISFEAMVQYVHHPSGQMPPYSSKVISDTDLASIYAYLKSQPKAQPAKGIPLLNQ